MSSSRVSSTFLIAEEESAVEESIGESVIGEMLESEEFEELFGMQEEYEAYQESLGIHETAVNDLLALSIALEYVSPEETLPELEEYAKPSYEQELLSRKHILPHKALVQEEFARTDLTTPLEDEETLRLLTLDSQAITLTDQRRIALLERYIFSSQPAWYMIILQQLVDMCSAGQLYLTAIQGKEALQKLMLQMYVPMYMETPSKMNMLSLRVTPATLLKLAGKSGTLYCQVASTGEAIKTKAEIVTAQKRQTQTKAVASGKTVDEPFPTRWEGGKTDDLEKDTKVGMSKNLTGKELMAFAVLTAVGVPVTVKRFFVHSIGLPENSKLYRRPFVTFIPYRITQSWKRRQRYTGGTYTTFRRDEYLKLMKKYGSRYGKP